ncbi:MAG: hypothetical protein JNK76_26895 [Planctomycetales bacterium]|nr:hypothetical protein [Planctomycetales bacterium]
MSKKVTQQAIAVLGGLGSLLALIVIAANSGGGTAEQRTSSALFGFYVITPIAVLVLVVLIAIFLWKVR